MTALNPEALEASAKAIYHSLFPKAPVDEHFAWYNKWKHQPESCVHSSTVADAVNAARVAVEAYHASEPDAVAVERADYLVWSNEHGCWWRANSSGYTSHLSQAGRYSRKEALEICADARGGWPAGRTPPEVPIREDDALAVEAASQAIRSPP